jgi:hypothetical protein
MLVALNSCSIRIVYGWSLCRSSQSPGFHSGSDEVDAPFFKFLSLPCVSSLPTEVDDDVTVAVTAFPPSFLPTLLMFICLPGNLSNHSHISISSRLPQLAPSSLPPISATRKNFYPRFGCSRPSLVKAIHLQIRQPPSNTSTSSFMTPYVSKFLTEISAKAAT